MNYEVLKLMNAEGVGRGKAERLIEEFGSYKEVDDASRQELREVHGIGPVLAWRIAGGVNSLIPAELTEE